MAYLGVADFREFVEAVRTAADIVRVVSDYVVLKPAGSRLKGLCPFHQEKTPSFSVDPSAQLFYCFGCSAGGDVFKFVQTCDKVDFKEAVDLLAQRFAVPRPAASGRGDDPRGRVLEINAEAGRFFRARLADPRGGERARAYLDRRGISERVAERLGLGYAPDSWEALRSHLVGKRWTPDQIVEAGLALRGKDPSRPPYDRFRDRLVFPIHDASGRTVAFGGRALGDAEPKYLNSPESPAYVKGDHLYGLHGARDAIRREGLAIVVEGYLDLAALLEAGIDNAVASLGTAFTPAQARLLARHTERVVMSYDGDAAGAAAAVRTFDLILDHGIEVRVADLPAGLDPDDFIRGQGGAAYSEIVRRAPGYVEWLARREARSRDLADARQRMEAVNAVLPHLARIESAVERGHWAGYVARAMGIDDALVLQDLERALRERKGSVPFRPERREGSVPDAERRLVSALLAHPEARERLRALDCGDDLRGARIAPIVGAILRIEDDRRSVDYATVLDRLDREEERALLTRIAFTEMGEIMPDVVDGCVEALKRRRIAAEERRVQHEIENADSAAVDDLLRKKTELARLRDAIS